MSSTFAPIPGIAFEQIFDGRLEKYGVREDMDTSTTESRRFLAGRDGFLEVHRDGNGKSIFIRRGLVPWSIFDALAEEFEVQFVGESDYRFWGFASEEEMDAFWDRKDKEAEDKFYNELLKYLRGEPNCIESASVPGVGH